MQRLPMRCLVSNFQSGCVKRSMEGLQTSGGGDENGVKKVHWCSWKRLTNVKGRGGLGFRDLQNFNKALLGKQIWRILTNPNLLLSYLLKAKYFPSECMLSCKVHENASWI